MPNDRHARLGGSSKAVGESIPGGQVIRGEDGLGHLALDEIEPDIEVVPDALDNHRYETVRHEQVGGEHGDRDEPDGNQEELGADAEGHDPASSGVSANR